MSDLISYADGGAGHCGVDTSIDGALYVQAKLGRLQAAAFNLIAAAGPNGATCDEIGAALDWAVYLVRPRATELQRMGKVIDSGVRRNGACGRPVIVWCLPEYRRERRP